MAHLCLWFSYFHRMYFFGQITFNHSHAGLSGWCLQGMWHHTLIDLEHICHAASSARHTVRTWNFTQTKCRLIFCPMAYGKELLKWWAHVRVCVCVCVCVCPSDSSVHPLDGFCPLSPRLIILLPWGNVHSSNFLPNADLSILEWHPRVSVNFYHMPPPTLGFSIRGHLASMT